MPAKSEKQAKFMRAVAHNKAFANRVGVPKSVGEAFSTPRGGEMKESKAMMKKEVAFMKKKGASKSMIKHEEAEMKGKTKKMLDGGIAAVPVRRTVIAPAAVPVRPALMKKGGSAKKMASGGLAAGHKSADGVAQRGKTKAKQITMKKGGKC